MVNTLTNFRLQSRPTAVHLVSHAKQKQNNVFFKTGNITIVHLNAQITCMSIQLLGSDYLHIEANTVSHYDSWVITNLAILLQHMPLKVNR
jgi:hypothetical protein